MNFNELVLALESSNSIDRVATENGCVSFRAAKGCESYRLSAVIEGQSVVVFSEATGGEVVVPHSFVSEKDLGRWIANNAYLIVGWCL